MNNLTQFQNIFKDINFTIKNIVEDTTIWVKYDFPCKNLSTLCSYKENDCNIWCLVTSKENAINCTDVFNTSGVLTMCNINDFVIYKDALLGEYITSSNIEMPFWKIKL